MITLAFLALAVRGRTFPFPFVGVLFIRGALPLVGERVLVLITVIGEGVPNPSPSSKSADHVGPGVF